MGYSTKATIADYVQLQGGRPKVENIDGLWHITHLYREDAPEIITHISPTERGTVTLSDGITYEVVYLWNFEGKPCERQSNISGGEGYSRRKL